jgi:hypothetical protein
MPALALATPAFAYGPALLSDSEQPGSVIVYPKFINELYNGGSPIVVDGQAVAQTEIEIGAVCPNAVVNAGGTCAEHLPIKIRFHWVCPGAEGVNSNICPEEDFDVNITVNGKLAFSANGQAINGNSPPLVPAPPCSRGYLIGWVISPANDLPIKFDGLIGNAVIRGGNLAAGPNAGSSTAVSAYNAVTIQADPAIAVQNPTPAVPGVAVPLGAGGALSFGVPGGYTTVTGAQIGDVRFDKTTPGSPLPNVLSRTSLTFLTLDVRSNQPNKPTFVNLDFWNESNGNAVGSTAPQFEHLTSTFTEFVCWAQVPLSALAGGNLTQSFQQTRKGVVIAGPAEKISDGNAPSDASGPVTLIGLVETIEGTAANNFYERKYNFNMSTNGYPQRTNFVPLGATVIYAP